VTPARHRIYSIGALVFISLVLRPPISAVGSLLNEISQQLHLNAASASLLTSVPVFCFGLGAFLSPWLMRRFGLNHAMFGVLVIVFITLALRVWFDFSILIVATILAGLGIAVANVLLPTFVRSDFKESASFFTSIYTTLLAIAASFAAAFAVPWSQFLGDWRLAMLTPLVPLAVAILLWWPRLAEGEPHLPVVGHAAKAEANAVYKSVHAWAILGFFGFQSLGFYVLLAWLPTMLIAAGMQPGQAGALLGFGTAIGIPTGFALAPLIARLKSLSLLAAIASTFTTAGFMLLTLSIANLDNQFLLYLALILISCGQTATFPMSLSLIATRASSKAQTTVLSAFAQGWGYLVSGAGTFAIGLVGASVSWVAAGWGIVACCIAQIAIAFVAGAKSHIGE
jgi:CP family cyanate transporter-like MFS transporter